MVCDIHRCGTNTLVSFSLLHHSFLVMNLSRVECILVVLTHSKFQFTILQVLRFHVLLKVRCSLQDSSRHEGNKFIQITLVCLNIRGSNQKINISCPRYFRNGKCLYQKRRISASTLESLGRRLVSLSFCKKCVFISCLINNTTYQDLVLQGRLTSPISKSPH